MRGMKKTAKQIESLDFEDKLNVDKEEGIRGKDKRSRGRVKEIERQS